MDKLDDLDVAQLVSRMPWWFRFAVRSIRRPLNRWLFYPVLGRAYERGKINNAQLHVLHAQFDPTQDGVIGRV